MLRELRGDKRSKWSRQGLDTDAVTQDVITATRRLCATAMIARGWPRRFARRRNWAPASLPFLRVPASAACVKPAQPPIALSDRPLRLAAGRFILARTDRRPRGQVFRAGKDGHVGPDLGEEIFRRPAVDARGRVQQGNRSSNGPVTSRRRASNATLSSSRNRNSLIKRRSRKR